MTGKLKRLAVIASVLGMGASAACAHKPEGDKLRSDYQASASDRLKAMDDHLAAIEKKANQQLPGTPKTQLNTALNKVHVKRDQAASELEKLDEANQRDWVQKKTLVDKRLYEMDKAYDQALQVMMQAH